MQFFGKERSQPLKVFVYGTLKPGEENYSVYCQDKVLKAIPAYIEGGKLFHLSLGYPAIVEGNGGKVEGFLLIFRDRAVLTQLDELEDYQCDRPLEENEYYRKEVPVFQTSGEFLGLAYAYFMCPETLKRIGGFPIQCEYWNSAQFGSFTSN